MREQQFLVPYGYHMVVNSSSSKVDLTIVTHLSLLYKLRCASDCKFDLYAESRLDTFYSPS